MVRVFCLISLKLMDKKTHWNKAYDEKPTEDLGWYEETPQPSIDLLNKINPAKSALIFNAGAGSSTLVDYLIKEGFENVLVNDISEAAIDHLRARLGEYQNKADYIVDDLTNPAVLNEIDQVDIWHDRAVLHFFLKEEEKQAYFDLLKNKVKQGGYVIIAEFSLEGAEKCCNLDLCRYNEEMISERLGSEFQLIESFNYTFINPRGGERPYIYTLYQRNG